MSVGGKTIIFVDEIDALAPSRDKGGAGGSELHNRIVATFLTLLDGVKPSAQEIGIIACCRLFLSFGFLFSNTAKIRALSAEACMLSYR